jgi:hypothetical protein
MQGRFATIVQGIDREHGHPFLTTPYSLDGALISSTPVIVRDPVRWPKAVDDPVGDAAIAIEDFVAHQFQYRRIRIQ